MDDKPDSKRNYNRSLSKTSRALTLKEEAFVLEYLKDLNASKAYARAGYKTKDGKGGHLAHQLIHKPHMEAAIEQAFRERQERTKVTVDKVVTELAKLAFTNMNDYHDRWDGTGIYLKPSTELTLEQTAAIESLESVDTPFGIKLKFKLYSKQTALQSLGEHLGMWGKKEKEQEDPLNMARKIQRFMKQANERTGG
jgi:phage terminase small subunit